MIDPDTEAPLPGTGLSEAELAELARDITMTEAQIEQLQRDLIFSPAEIEALLACIGWPPVRSP
ncbi:MAG TPA: hypothetical protein VN790_07615 [Steroidobacteraceae bacterium]|nr:hypothetical protein [Steroidobacteraceae bacterium]